MPALQSSSPSQRPSVPRTATLPRAPFAGLEKPGNGFPGIIREDAIGDTSEAALEAREALRDEMRHEAREQALETITRFLIWIAEGEGLVRRGLRATVALYCTRRDLIGGCSLSEIGEMGDCTEQAAQKLARQFRQTVNLRP